MIKRPINYFLRKNSLIKVIDPNFCCGLLDYKRKPCKTASKDKQASRKDSEAQRSAPTEHSPKIMPTQIQGHALVKKYQFPYAHYIFIALKVFTLNYYFPSFQLKNQNYKFFRITFENLPPNGPGLVNG